MEYLLYSVKAADRRPRFLSIVINQYLSQVRRPNFSMAAIFKSSFAIMIVWIRFPLLRCQAANAAVTCLLRLALIDWLPLTTSPRTSYSSESIKLLKPLQQQRRQDIASNPEEPDQVTCKKYILYVLQFSSGDCSMEDTSPSTFCNT